MVVLDRQNTAKHNLLFDDLDLAELDASSTCTVKL